MTISMFEQWYAALYPLFDIWLVLYTIFIVSTRKRTSKLFSKNMATLRCYGLLGALSSYSCTGLVDIHHPLSIATLPLLDMYVEENHLFQLVNVVGVFRAISNSNAAGWLNLLVAAIHAYLFCTLLGDKGLQMLKDIKEMLLYTKELRLISIQKVRNIVLSDIEALPKRMLLESALHGFKYNVNERMFLLRAIFRMMWQPMVPLLVLTTLLNAMQTISAVASGRMLYFFDTQLEYSWYVACFNVMIVFVLTLLSEQINRVEAFVNIESTRVIGSLRLTLFRLPLLNDGLQNNYRIHEAKSAVRGLVDTLRKLHSLFSLLTRVTFDWVYLYNTIGWPAFIPLAMHFLDMLLKIALRKVTGPEYMWGLDSYEEGYDGKPDEIFYNIKSIKMFGWERMFTDPKLQQHWKDVESKRKNVWYAPIARTAWFVLYIFGMISSQLSVYLSLLAFMHSNSGPSAAISVATILQIERQTNTMQFNFSILVFHTLLLQSTTESVYAIEQALRGDYINTLRRNSLTLENEKSKDSALQKCQLTLIVAVKAGEFAWTKDKPVVKNVSFEANPGDLVAVVGKTGSGKSSLLMSICGEVEMTKGTGAVVGSIALVEQTPWVMSGTLRKNILFGRDYDEEFYNKVVFACALSEDIANWKDGDRTRIGEHGMNVSGGQKARIALARAVYSRADIYILDDPLSAVDPHVMRHLLNHVIMDTGILAGKIRVMSLHENRLLSYFSMVLQLEKGKDVVALKQNPQKYQPKTVDMSSVPKNAPTLMETEDDEVESALDSESNKELLTLQNSEADSEDDDELDASSSKQKKYSNLETLKYIVRLFGIPTLLLIGSSTVLMPISDFLFTSYKLAALNESDSTDVQSNKAILDYLLLRVINDLVFQCLLKLEIYVENMVSEKFVYPRVKSIFIDSIIHAPISFFDNTTRQELSISYNDSTEYIATKLHKFFMSTMSQLLSACLAIYSIGMKAPQLLVLTPLLVWVSSKSDAATTPVQSALEDIYDEACVDESKVEDVIADGQHLIRIFNVEKQFTSMYIKEKDKKQHIRTSMSLIDGVTSTVYDFVMEVSRAACGIAMVLQKHMFKNSLSSLDFLIFKDLIDDLVINADSILSIPKNLRTIKREIGKFRGYTSLEREKLVEDNALVPEKNWPSDGKIEFNNFSMKYHQDLEYVLKNINLTINPGERIGIVGRTGAGKTSLARSLFQLVDKSICNGSILIDGHDTFSMNRRDVRAKLGIIPQDPTLFSGSYRQNLDPLVKYSVEDMWSAILKCGMDELVQPKHDRNKTQNEKIVAEGEHDNELKEIDRWNQKWNSSGWAMRAFLYLFVRKPVLDINHIRRTRSHGLDRHVKDTLSNGQKQLVGLCRLLMRNRKIIVLDEATSSMDQESDQDMQKLIRSEFKDCTVLTIAHRLKTIMGSDRIVVLNNGRVVEVGPPSELLEKGGHFAELVKANEF